ncbi:MAG: hypothetical protein MJ153_01380 [Clostridia bacterium]|nr:hypothetical protein [Clostridia bacterium]
MNNYLKRIFSFIVALMYVFSLSACNADARKAVVEVAQNFTDALSEGDVNAYLKLIDKDSDNYEEHIDFITEWFDDSDIDNLDDEEIHTAECAIFDTLSFEVDEDSAEAYEQTGEGTVDVVAEYVDFKKLIERKWNTASIDAFLTAVSESKSTVQQKLSLKMVLVDDKWIVTDFSDVEKLLKAIEFNLHFKKNYKSGIDYLEWWYPTYEGSHLYCDTDIITLCAKLNDIGKEFYWQYYYTVEYKNELIYKSSFRTFFETDYIDAFLFSSYDGCPIDNSGNYIAPGQYTFTFYDSNDVAFASDTCFVTSTSPEKPEDEDTPSAPFSGTPVGMDLLEKYYEDSEDEEFEHVEIEGDDGCSVFYDSDFYEYIIDYCWWDYSFSTACSNYCKETDCMAYSLLVDESSFMSVYYEYYNVVTGELLFARTVSPTTYEDGTYYDIDYEVEEELAPGSYMLIVMNSSHKNVLFTSTVEVTE